MAKSSTGKGSDFSAGSSGTTKPAPQPTKRASWSGTQARTKRAAGPR